MAVFDLDVLAGTGGELLPRWLLLLLSNMLLLAFRLSAMETTAGGPAESGKAAVESGEATVESGEAAVESGERAVESGKSAVDSGEAAVFQAAAFQAADFPAVASPAVASPAAECQEVGFQEAECQVSFWLWAVRSAEFCFSGHS